MGNYISILMILPVPIKLVLKVIRLRSQNIPSRTSAHLTSSAKCKVLKQVWNGKRRHTCSSITVLRMTTWNFLHYLLIKPKQARLYTTSSASFCFKYT
jgi:hypothetical protein